MLKLLVSLSLICSSFALAAPAADDHVMLRPDEIKWAKGPNFLPAGAEIAILYGDPTAAGPFGLRIKMPDKYKIPMHFHPTDENVVVISGELMMGGHDAGATMTALPVGSFAHMNTGVHHQVQANGETIVQVNAVGPFGITYVDPKDDPRN